MQTAGADTVTEFLLDDRAFQMELVGQYAEPYGAMGLLHVSVVGSDVHDG